MSGTQGGYLEGNPLDYHQLAQDDHIGEARYHLHSTPPLYTPNSFEIVTTDPHLAPSAPALRVWPITYQGPTSTGPLGDGQVMPIGSFISAPMVTQQHSPLQAHLMQHSPLHPPLHPPQLSHDSLAVPADQAPDIASLIGHRMDNISVTNQPLPTAENLIPQIPPSHTSASPMSTADSQASQQRSLPHQAPSSGGRVSHQKNTSRARRASPYRASPPTQATDPIGSERSPPVKSLPYMPLEEICSNLRHILETEGTFRSAREICLRLRTNPKRVYEAINVLLELNLIRAEKENYRYLGADHIHKAEYVFEYLNNHRNAVETKKSRKYQLFSCMRRIIEHPRTVAEVQKDISREFFSSVPPANVSEPALRRRLYDFVKILESFGLIVRRSEEGSMYRGAIYECSRSSH